MWYNTPYVKPLFTFSFRIINIMPRVSKAILPPLKLVNETIAQRITCIRKQRGYTQKELANKIGIERHLISDYERGKIRLYDEMVARFAIALGISTDDLLGLKESNHIIKDVPSLRIIKRVKRIEKLPLSKQKSLLQIIDGFLKSEGK